MEPSDLPPQEPDEQRALCDRASQGDPRAIERLLWMCHRRLLDFAQRKIGVDWRGKIEAEDLLQEAYIYVFQHAEDYEPRGVDSFYHWVAMVIDHRFIDRVRHARRQKRDVTREVPGQHRLDSSHAALLDRCTANHPRPSQLLRREEAIGALMSCIAKLPDDYRFVVQRYYLDEEPLSSIAEGMGKSTDAVRRMAGRATERLSHCLGHARRYLSSHG